ncbi:hypothetical protein PENTCL1PPCAC_7735 [Pristionchus entomophagus]|uniref:C-type lectin n=1 Tax=Pristionchus entomophagus TaxID=358040 RepID=A0AAV5SZN0_9BILA|nr:hypothetical protein PENTCL1PPCAC_7735 [Pristionchus entomophagus]
MAGLYSWADGSDLDYSNFADGFRNNSVFTCVAMKTTNQHAGQWTNMDCALVDFPYVCTRRVLNPTSPPPQPPGCPVKTQYARGDEIFSPSFPEAPGASSCDYLLIAPNSKS